MCKFNPKNESRRIDPCMRYLIKFLQLNGIKTLACCCGHGKYPMTIICDWGAVNLEIFHNFYIPRKRRFYSRDKQGIYYIPEVLK